MRRLVLALLILAVAVLCVAQLVAYEDAKAAHPRVVLGKHQHRAQPKPEWHGTAAQALAIAERKANELWGVKPCGGNFRVETDAALEPEVAGQAVWNSATGGNYESPPTTWTDCVLRLSPELTFQTDGPISNWPVECTIVMHEWGHLTGHPHSDVPNEAPEPMGMTREQLEVMRSGHSLTGPDLHRCGWEP